MRIGKQDAPFTSICTSDADSITVRGKDLCGDIIGKMDFTSYFWLLVTGSEPTDVQKFFANAVLAAIAEHGLVPSVVAARMTYAAAPEAFHGAVAAGLLGCGSVVLGSAEVAGRFYADLVDQVENSGKSAADIAAEGVRTLRADQAGHPRLWPSAAFGGRSARAAAARHGAASTASSASISACFMPCAIACPRRSAARCRSTSMARSRQ